MSWAITFKCFYNHIFDFIKWSLDHYEKAILWPSNKHFNTSINILHDEKSVKLLGIDIDSMLKYYVHIAIFAKKLPDN